MLKPVNPQVLQVTQITLSLAATTGMNFKTACPSPPLRPLHRHPFIRQNPIYSVVLPTADAEEKHTSYTLSFMVKVSVPGQGQTALIHWPEGRVSTRKDSAQKLVCSQVGVLHAAMLFLMQTQAHLCKRSVQSHHNPQGSILFIIGRATNLLEKFKYSQKASQATKEAACCPGCWKINVEKHGAWRKDGDHPIHILHRMQVRLASLLNE